MESIKNDAKLRQTMIISAPVAVALLLKAANQNQSKADSKEPIFHHVQQGDALQHFARSQHAEQERPVLCPGCDYPLHPFQAPC
mmetsp:Transcript_23680/g.49604  ORF Transcript_23680/g.49604 Transcript_23680/m.49604 type:complete len:84 (-) Transcript_23680:442-693(-)